MKGHHSNISSRCVVLLVVASCQECQCWSNSQKQIQQPEADAYKCHAAAFIVGHSTTHDKFSLQDASQYINVLCYLWQPCTRASTITPHLSAQSKHSCQALQISGNVFLTFMTMSLVICIWTLISGRMWDGMCCTFAVSLVVMLATDSQRARETHGNATPMQLRECQSVQRLLLDCRRVIRCHTMFTCRLCAYGMHLAVLKRLSKIKMPITTFTPKL